MRSSSVPKPLLTLFLVLCPSVSIALAHPSGPPSPPKEAIEACSQAKELDTCSLSFHGRTIEGTCLPAPDGTGPLACVPPPPPEAMKACAELREGDNCTVEHHGRTMKGTCHTGPGGKGALACMPPRPAP